MDECIDTHAYSPCPSSSIEIGRIGELLYVPTPEICRALSAHLAGRMEVHVHMGNHCTAERACDRDRVPQLSLGEIHEIHNIIDGDGIMSYHMIVTVQYGDRCDVT